MKKRNKIITIATALCISLVAIGVGAYSYLADSKEDNKTVTTGTVSIDLKEIFPNEGGEYGETTKEKTFWGVATGTKKSLARASIFVTVEYKEDGTDEWVVLGNVPSSAVTYKVDPETQKTWKEGNDGYYYYQKILEPNDTGESSDTYVDNPQTTSQFKLTDVSISDEYDSIVSEKNESGNVRVNMLVTMETCQATNGAYKLSWENCDTSALPEGVVID